NYLVAGMLVEALTSRTWAQEVTDRIVRPLRLRATSVPGDDPALPPPHAHGYARIGGQVVNVTRYDTSAAGAAGAITSTTADLDRFLDALLDGRLLPPAQLAQMQRLTAASPGYGLGLMRVELPCGEVVWGHDGGIHGYASLALSTPDTRERLVLSMSTAPDPGELRGYAELVGEAFCD
ncbi:serine hydrolase domain-containing protein, partial [Kineococcus glutinatus]|uniref:serine hydrolase domain-containing protein n=1 Tax=Kineococcus glutinatus TaxID=1070872 RepID=UPI0031F12CC1